MRCFPVPQPWTQLAHGTILPQTPPSRLPGYVSLDAMLRVSPVVILSTTADTLETMPLSLAQAHVLVAAANDHALANGWKIAVAVVDEGGLLVALGRMDGAFPLSAQIAEAKAAGTALWHRDGERLAASREAHEGFFDAVSRLARLPLIPGPGAVVIRSGEDVLGAAGASGASGDDDRACVEAGLRAVFPGWTRRSGMTREVGSRDSCRRVRA